jgi:uncharacterized protein (TIRG00374 family)
MKALAVPRASYFVASAGQPRVRRPRDVLTVVVGLLLIVWALFTVDNSPAWEQAFVELVASSPSWVQSLLSIGYLLSLVYVLIVIGGAIPKRRERDRMLRDLVIVAVGTVVLVVLLSFLVNGAWPYVLPEIDLQNPEPRFPVTRVALVTSLLVVMAPHMTRPLRRFGWLAMVTTAVASVGLSYGSPMHTVGSFGIGLFCAGTYLVIAGSPRGYPHPETVSATLETLGVLNRDIRPAPYQTWGVVRFVATDHDGKLVDIKVHGRDAFDSQLAAKVWHTMWYRETERTVSFSRLQAVEHEALITVLADRAGLKVPDLAAVGSASPELALIAFRGSGQAIAEVDQDLLTDEFLVRIWEQVALLHQKMMSHGSLDTSAVHYLPSGPVITDFALGSLAADDADQGADVAELLFSLAVLVGEERAVDTALRGLGESRLVGALPYLQVPAVSSSTRRLAQRPKVLMTTLADAVADVTGSARPEPVQLRRVSVSSLITLGLILLLAFALIPRLTQVDYAEIWSVLQHADWALIVLAVLVGHTQFFPSATSTMFAVSVKLPFWPLLILQTASQFIALAIPSSAGRVAMNAAFLHKFGVSITTALAQGAIDGFSGFLVQVALLLIILLTGDIDLGLNIDPADVPWLLILGIVVLLVIVVIVVVLKVPRIRDRVVPVITQGWDALLVVMHQPSRAIGLLVSNFVFWNVLGLTLWIVIQSVGSNLSYSSALFVAAGTSLLAGFMPIPGGVGVAEATMTALLVTTGLDQHVAIAVTATYRLITFYLPALEGFFGTRWLQRHEYI